jgi:hypothetical protein
VIPVESAGPGRGQRRPSGTRRRLAACIGPRRPGPCWPARSLGRHRGRVHREPGPGRADDPVPGRTGPGPPGTRSPCLSWRPGPGGPPGTRTSPTGSTCSQLSNGQPGGPSTSTPRPRQPGSTPTVLGAARRGAASPASDPAPARRPPEPARIREERFRLNHLMATPPKDFFSFAVRDRKRTRYVLPSVSPSSRHQPCRPHLGRPR